MSLKDKVIIVTGGTGGIGRAIINKMADAGAHVYFTYALDRESAGVVENSYKEFPNRISGYQVDVRNYEASQEFVNRVIIEQGAIDVVVNNAGIRKDSSLALMKEESWNDVIQTNLSGIYNISKQAVIHMIKHKQGRIINISSVSGIYGLKGQVNYSASKAGVIGFTRALGKEVAGYGITVNVVAPGVVDTDMLNGLSRVYINELVDQIPIKRKCRPEEVAMVVACLADRGLTPDYLTGQVITLDGGMGL